jgi:hypothetical protein
VNADRLVRWTAVAAVLAVAGVAAWISYRHAVDVVTVHGEPGAVGHWYPVCIDGLIIAASMVLLDAARHREAAPPLAWLMLSAGIGATLAVNVLAGVASGPLGAVIAAWPAAAFVGCYELLMLLVRASARRAPEAEIRTSSSDLPGASEMPPDPSLIRAALNGHAVKAEKLFAADLEAGRIPGVRRIQAQMHVGQPKARLLQAHLRSLTRTP